MSRKQCQTIKKLYQYLKLQPPRLKDYIYEMADRLIQKLNRELNLNTNNYETNIHN